VKKKESFITPAKFNQWLTSQSKVNDRITFHRGTVCTTPAYISDVVCDAYLNGEIEIFHKKVSSWGGDDGKDFCVYEQIAVRIDQKLHRKLDELHFHGSSRRELWKAIKL